MTVIVSRSMHIQSLESDAITRGTRKIRREKDFAEKQQLRLTKVKSLRNGAKFSIDCNTMKHLL